MMSNFRTYQLAKEFHQSCQSLQLKGPMKDQFERAVLSIVLNIAEGSGKLTRKDKARFYSIALGSLRETQALLDLLGDHPRLAQADRLGASLYRLLQSPGGQ